MADAPPAAAAAAAAANAEAGNGQQPQEEVRLLHDLEHYVRSRGLAPPADEDEGPSADVFFDNRNHASERLKECVRHQESVHKSAFAAHDEKEKDVAAGKEQLLASLKGKMIAVVAGPSSEASGSTQSVPLDALASKCDTVYALVRSQPLFSRQRSALSSDSSTAGDEDDDVPKLELPQFDPDPVGSFLTVVVHDQPISSIPDDHIVEVCRIAHYVQCSQVLDATVDILKESVDADNCLSLCHLADQLGVPSLFEASVSYLIGKLDNMQDHEQWDDFPSTLRNRIVCMRNAVQSSILGRGQKTSVFFSSSEEFLAIFSDNIQDQKERLCEARRRQEEVISERIHREGRIPWTGSVADAKEKIERQAKRLKTLESFYQEQRMIFATDGSTGTGSGKAVIGQKPYFNFGYS
eukprot:CAMPEP_0178689796 /NCGR_PEP_ID=MMETSP0699-20121125/5733_1 /TAXON_ID=265572 /ORGANISM="Extubocellulus spinifer, Strain CCMP396" /LENGTH=408 /DNA_ID=CAMNT_0020334891 /DNA_START=46 /DNA_END=1272 /DNA_ORIENTATION=+